MPALRAQLQRTLGDSFTIERELGGAAMSRVFVARDNALGRTVVVKVLPPDMLEGISVERFRREILLVARLQHPHIVPVHSAGEANGLPYFTMPFVPGLSLRDRLEEVGQLEVAEATSILRDVARALAHAHEQGVIHRDIKPENVLLSGGVAVMTDFGVAKAISASRDDTIEKPATITRAGVVVGTPEYMAPEQATGSKSVDQRADIYAFGCMAYELLTGAPPFVEKLTHRTLAAHIQRAPVLITERRRDIPAALGALVMRCLEKDREARPQDAGELVRVLTTTWA